MQRTLPIAPSPGGRRTHLAALVALALAIVTLVLLAPGVALAQSRVNEGAARALQKKAMEDDYLNTDFDKATDKLNQAIAKCGADKCGVPLRAQLRRDLAAVASAAGKKDQALSAMTDALKIDAGLQLDPNFKTKELDAIYAEAKKAATNSGPSGPPPAGDFTHIPPAEQQVRTPIPIYVEYTGSETLKRVMAKYKGLGMTEWKSLELKPIGSGFGANTPCADVQAGDFLYYIQGFNDQNDPVASGGDRTTPYRVNVKNDAVADPPHLPGQAPPTQCADKGDCPPDFPGCKKGAAAVPDIDTSLKPEGESCEDDSECQSSQCKDTKCTAPPEKPGTKRKKFWIGVAGAFDFGLLASAQNVCELYVPATVGGVAVPTSATTPPVGTGSQIGTPTNGKGYYCTFNGNDYPTRSSPNEAVNIVHNSQDQVSSGFAPGDVRILLTFDYALTTSQMLGLHVGYVTGTYKGTIAPKFAPIQAEARYSYVFGDDPIGKAGIHPFLLGGLGIGEFDENVSVQVVETPSNGGIANPQCKAAAGEKCGPTVSAWQTGGPFFLEEGVGARWEIVSGFALLADLKLVEAIGGSAGFRFVPTPEVAAQVGF